MEPLLFLLVLIFVALLLALSLRRIIEALEELVTGLLKIAWIGAVIALVYAVSTTLIH